MTLSGVNQISVSKLTKGVDVLVVSHHYQSLTLLTSIYGNQLEELIVGSGAHYRRIVKISVLLMPLFALTACSHSGLKSQAPPSASQPAATPTIDPRALPAVEAFEALDTRTNNAERNPKGPDQKLPPEADYAAYAFDPLLAQNQSVIWGLWHDGVQFRGTPPVPHITVAAIELDAPTWPTVILHDCEIGGQTWQAYNSKTGAQLPRTTPKVPPPYRATVTMIRYKAHWGAQKIDFDQSRTCTR